jgi:hypothetical protein
MGSRRSFTPRFFLGILAVLLCHGINAFQLSMVASRAPLGNFQGPTTVGRTDTNSQSSFRTTPQSATGGITSGLISQLAVVALKLRLHDQTHVSCDVSATSSNILLRGLVGQVTVNGRGWQSRLGLTCRAIEATVDSCELDVGRILSSRKLVLTRPGKFHVCRAMRIGPLNPLNL